MINRPFRTVLARLGLVAAILATLLILAPVAFAAEEIDYEENRTDPVATLSATDEDGDDIEWSLSGDDAADFAISDDGVLTFKKAPNYESPADANKNNVYLVSVSASETSDALDLEITVMDVDEAGSVSLTQPQPQVGRDLVASLSDQDAGVEDERWQWARGETADGPWTDIDRATSASRRPGADDLNMYLRATVTYEDKFGTGKMASAVTENAVEERTTANAAPSFSGLDETTGANAETPTNIIVVNRNVDEGVSGANVGKPIAATDADNDVLLYSIESIEYLAEDAAAVTQARADFSFSIDSRNGQLKTAEKLNSDDDGLTGTTDDTDGENRYTVEVKATDPSGASTTQDVTVTVNDVNDAPTFGDEPATGAQNRRTLRVVENTRDLDADLTTEAADAPTYLATDADAGDDATTVSTATPPTVALAYEVGGADKGAFQITLVGGSWTLAFKSTHNVNFEAKDEYEITIVASDDSAPEGVGMVNVTVNVMNAEDAGTVTPTQREPQVGKEVVVALSDQDGNIRGQSWQWYRNVDSATTGDAQDTALDGAPACTATTDGTTVCSITGATSPNYTPVRADISYDTASPPAVIATRRLAARVTYTDTYVTLNTDTPPTDTGDSAFVVMQASAEIENPANAAPKFRDDQDPNTPGDQPDAERDVPENAKGRAVGDPVTASDAGDLLIYSLSGADADSFTIDSGLKSGDTPGLIKTAVELDYETKDMYTVVVTATDPSGATDTINVNIEVTDEDDKTVVTLVNMMDGEIDYDEGGTDPVATLSAMDQDGDEIEWSLAGDDAADFNISDDGVLTFKKAPNYESPDDANKNNVYLVSVNASETSDPQNLEITVVDVDEDGKVSLTQPQPQVGRGLVASLSDQDAGVEDEKWQWARGETADGPWTDIDRATTASRMPVADDLNMYLRATVTYEDKFGTGKMASAVTENSVEDRTTANTAPSFKGQDETGPTVDDQNESGDPAGIQDDIIVTRNVDEGVSGANVGKPITATDADNDVLLYAIDAIQYDADDADAVAQARADFSFSIDSRNGQLKTAEKLNSDDDGLTGDADTAGEHMYIVTVKATDPSGASTTQDVTVTVNDVNDAPTFGDPTGATNRKVLTVTENDRATLDGDPDAADAQAPLYLATDADAGDAATTDSAATPPTVALTYEVTGADSGAFQITNETAGWTLAFKSTHNVNFEAKDEYEITIVASDDSAPEGVGMVNVTVNVMNAEDAGTITPTQREPQVGKEVVAALSDQDGNIRGQSWQWYRNAAPTVVETDLTGATTACAADTTTLCPISGAMSPNYTPVMADVPAAGTDTRLVARVTYTDTYVTPVDPAATPIVDSGDSAFVVMQASTEIENPANTAPKFRDDQDPNTPGDQPDAERDVPENAKGMAVGNPVTASDPGDLLIYSLSGADADSFTVDSGLKSGDTPGQIKTAVELDYETKDMYMVVLTATDPSGATDTINVNITVLDEDDKTVVSLGAAVNTPPAFPAGTATRNVGENMAAGTAVGDPVMATDEDAGDTLTYSLVGSDYFGIDESSGQISTTMMLDHEAMSTHLVTVTATDGEDSDTVDVTINVENAHTGCDTVGNMGLVNDCEALLDSKDALGGSLNWTDHTHTPMSDWDGVTMSGDPMRVTAINLRDMGLNGSIPGALGRLSMLTSLNLRSNADLSGEIPAELGNLMYLTVLNLHSNSHSGGIPDLSGTSLTELYLPGNDLTGSVPAWLNMMTDMTELWLWGNDLSGDLPDLSGMTSLDKLKLNGNADLTGIEGAKLPMSLRWLVAGQTDVGATMPDLSGTSLTTLWLNETGLSGTIPVANIPTSVTSLNLKDNSLSGAIPDMSGLDNLVLLRLHRNDLSGDIPGTMGDMDSIQRIWIYENELTGISAGLDNASDTLTHLYVTGNPFAEGTCLAGDLSMIENNDFEDAGLAACQ